MAREFTAFSFISRLVFALVLVFGTYNPTDYSYVSWVMNETTTFGPVTALVGVALLIAWIVFLRATFMSMGWLGIILGAALFGCVVWLFVDLGWLALDSSGAITWVALVLVAFLLAVGMSWSHIRRRLTGQFDVDDVED
ncbi:hypothetical protein F0M18_07075 [Pseudohalioglobus sediminis]|uniref:Uncharacterized protein n=1 Tax=Pseudohalioglobus sediminis TaxID=2606449 RepID=A0A5B0WZI2_9GAMM|nr:DUF6524 family protein [Pseudohalioglobus sediminis]KAA1192426.1 hypothetical protein F0M18_07075 [Pseudohalioglobus sediminis]